MSVITGKEYVNFATPKGIYPFFSCSKQVFKCDKFAYNGYAILIAGNGDFHVKAYIGKFNAYQRTYVLMPDNTIYFATIFYSAVNMVNKFKLSSNGAIVKFIKKKDIENIPVILPKNKCILTLLNSILIAQLQIEKYSEHLTSLRDFLLPLLMNTQAVIKE